MNQFSGFQGTEIFQKVSKRGVYPEEESATFPNVEEFREIIRFLPNWRATGPDGVYNYFIKRLYSLHSALHEAIREVCMGSVPIPSELLHGTTHLIRKVTPEMAANFAPSLV